MSNTDKSTDSHQYELKSGSKKVVMPLTHDNELRNSGTSNSAADLIRQKLDSLYVTEPSAKEEINEVQAVSKRSKHQEFMFQLSNSGKSLAAIQTEWHAYYSELPNDEKHEVWQEFYANQHHTPQQSPEQLELKASNEDEPMPKATQESAPAPLSKLKKQLLGSVESRSKVTKKHHLQSLLFGLGMGSFVLLIFMFSFFNERIIAPFITPAKAVSATPIIIDPTGSTVGPEPKIIIPKINVEIPIDFEEPTINEDAIQRSLEKGVVHYPTTSNPGELGNGVIFGHSANNIFNKGKYKFAFVLLKRLENGDTFYIQKDSKRYVYKVFDKKVVSPSEVSVLYPTFPDKPSTFTLITCDPPGTSLNRLVVTAEQISPDPAANVASSASPQQQVQVPKELPSNSITLWQRIKNWLN